MNIRQLRFFEEAARRGSFSAAALAQHVTVQAVSKSISELADELGGRLFERSGKGVVLTPLGAAILDPAQKAVASFDAVGAVAESWRRVENARSGLRIALVTPPFAKHQLVCGLISRLLSHTLDVSTEVSVSLGPDALAGLRAGTVDALVTIGRLDAPHCVCSTIGTVSPGVFLGGSHPLAHKRTLTFEDLRPYPVLRSEAIDGFNDTILASCQRRGLASVPVDVSTDAEVVDLLERRQGFIMSVHLKALSVRPFAVIHELDPADAVPVPVCLVTLEGATRPEIERLKGLVRGELPLLKRLLDSEGNVGRY